MNSEDTERKPKWRLLELEEITESGDKELDVNFIWRDTIPGREVTIRTAPIRRRMTPAEENAEELLDSLRDLRKWVNLSKPPFVSHPAYRSSEAKHISAIAKAEGVRHP